MASFPADMLCENCTPGRYYFVRVLLSDLESRFCTGCGHYEPARPVVVKVVQDESIRGDGDSSTAARDHGVGNGVGSGDLPSDRPASRPWYTIKTGKWYEG